jgi:hypothetical protein
MLSIDCPSVRLARYQSLWAVLRRKQVSRLMSFMGSAASTPGTRTNRSHRQQLEYPYLIRRQVVDRLNQVWAAEIVCTKMTKANMFAARSTRSGEAYETGCTRCDAREPAPTALSLRRVVRIVSASSVPRNSYFRPVPFSAVPWLFSGRRTPRAQFRGSD